MKAVIYIFISLSLLIWPGRAAHAIQPEKREALAYKYYAFNGSEHKITYAPPAAETIFLMANTDNTFDPRYTLVYYWPLTHEYFQSWERLDEPVSGKLEILQGDRIIQEIEREKVVMFYPKGVYAGGSKILRGNSAIEKFEAYQRAFKSFKRASAEYYRQMVIYELRLRKLMRQRRSGNTPLNIPPKPTVPERLQFQVSEYRDEMVVNLPAGKYSMRLRDGDNLIVEGSKRDIFVFESLGQTGIGYKLIPEERWTKRLSLYEPESGIYTQATKSFFLVPYRTEAFDENNHNRLLNPQNPGRKRVKKWIQRNALLYGQLVLIENGEIVRHLDYQKFHVEQTRGAELGYRIKAYINESEAKNDITFEAFHLQFNNTDHGKRYTIAVMDPASGRIYDDSRREVRIVGKVQMTPVWMIAFVPGIIGLSIHGWRRSKKVKHWEIN